MSLELALFFAAFLALLLLGLEVAWALIASSVLYMLVGGHYQFLPLVPERLYQGMDIFVLMAVPLFILTGEVIGAGNIADRLIHLANVVVGWLKGGLAHVNIAASLLFSGITGIALGDIAAIGRVLIPAMVKEGYSAAYAAAVTASSSIIGPLVPPSLVIVIYGSVTNTSIGGLFAAAIVPGIVIALVQMVLVAWQAHRSGFEAVKVDRSPRAVVRASGDALLPLAIPVLIVVSIVGGVMTPTEAGGAAAIFSLVLAMAIYRTITVRQLAPILARTVRFTGQLVIIVGAGAIFSWVMANENVPRMLQGFVADLDLPAWTFLVVLNLFFLVIGMLIDPSTAIVMFAPIVVPMAAIVGIDPLHLGTIIVLNLNIGLLTPPLGVCLFAAERIALCGLGPLIRATLPFLAINVVGLALITYVPALSTTLPRLVGFD
ncbi:MAG: TRAP transporter large permease [Azospirillaceae bacterium]